MIHIRTLVVSVLFFYSCAHIVPPEGGPKDVTPPVLLKSSPKEGSVNISPSKIVFRFDENIELVNIRENISITPDIHIVPLVRVSGKKMTVTLPSDSLKKNTTYTINFKNSVVDLNEKNVLKNFSYSFCTGPVADTLQLRGMVYDVRERKSISGATILLQNELTRVSYSATSGDSGLWKIKNIASGQYQLLIFADHNLNKQLDYREFYFLKNLILDSQNMVLNTGLIRQNHFDSATIKVNNVKYVDEYRILVMLNHPVEHPEKILYSLPGMNEKKNPSLWPTERKDSLILFHPYTDSDTISLTIATDTIQKFVILQPKSRKAGIQKFRPVRSLYRKGDPLYISSTIPIKNIQSEKIHLNKDFYFNLERQDPYSLKLTGPSSDHYVLIINQGAVQDINLADNLADTLYFSAAEEEQSGNLEFTVYDKNPDDSVHIRVRLFNETSSYNLTGVLNNPFKINGLLSGPYSIEVWEDRNNNAVWDEGNYFTGQYPEKIKLIREAIMIKANWDNLGVDIHMD